MKVEKEEGRPNVRPFNLVEGLFKVNFEDHKSFLSSHLPEVGEVLLDNDCIVNSCFVGQEASLGRANDEREEGFDFIDNDFGDKLASSVT